MDPRGCMRLGRQPRASSGLQRGFCQARHLAVDGSMLAPARTVTSLPPWSWAGCFHKTTKLEHALALELGPAEQLQRCRVLAEQGYHPAGLTAGEIGKRLVTGSVWLRPAEGEQALEQLAKRQATAAVALLRLGQPKKTLAAAAAHRRPAARAAISSSVSLVCLGWMHERLCSGWRRKRTSPRGGLCCCPWASTVPT